MMKIRLRPASPRRASSVSSRRAFVRTMGAGVSAALVPAVSAARTAPEAVDDPVLRLLLLEEEQAVRRLHQAFEQAMDSHRYDDVVAMFADDAEVTFNGGVFRNTRGVTRLYRELFQAGRSGGRMSPAPGFELAADQHGERVTVAPHRLSATAIFPYSIQVGAPFESDNSLASMARLQGEGVRSWWEGGVYDATYRKQVADGPWTISRLEYRTLSRADYRPGRTYAAPIAVARLTVRYPADRLGPDDLTERDR